MDQNMVNRAGQEAQNNFQCPTVPDQKERGSERLQFNFIFEFCNNKHCVL